MICRKLDLGFHKSLSFGLEMIHYLDHYLILMQFLLEVLAKSYVCAFPQNIGSLICVKPWIRP